MAIRHEVLYCDDRFPRFAGTIQALQRGKMIHIHCCIVFIFFDVEILLSRETKNNQNWCGYEKNNRIYLNLSYSLFYLHTFVRLHFSFK